MITSKISLLIDTDPGQDDALALFLAIKSLLFQIIAVTTVAGNSSIENVTRNARFILSILKDEQIPVYSGRGNPLSRDLIQAVVHGDTALDGVDTSNILSLCTGDAAEKICELVLSQPGNITILALGPLTNLARAFLLEASLPEKVLQIVIMGGAISVPGNMTRVSEFNLFVDPEAAEIVFKAHVKKILIPLDVCNQAVLTLEDFELLNGSELYVPIMAMMDKYIQAIRKDEGVNGAIVYDAIAAYYLINPEAFVMEEMDVVIETKGEITRGMTVVENRRLKKKQMNCLVAKSVNAIAFKQEFFSILTRMSNM